MRIVPKNPTVKSTPEPFTCSRPASRLDLLADDQHPAAKEN